MKWLYGLFLTLWTVAFQAPLSMGFSRQEYWCGLLCLPPGDLPDLGMEPMSACISCISGRYFTHWTTWEAHVLVCVCVCVCIIYIYYIYLPQTGMVLMTKYKQLYKVLGKYRSRLKERIDSAVIMQICGKFLLRQT